MRNSWWTPEMPREASIRRKSFAANHPCWREPRGRPYLNDLEFLMKPKSVSLALLGLLVSVSIDGFAQIRAASREGEPPAALPTPQTSPAAARRASPRQGLLIGAGDLLHVSLYGAPDFNTQVRVNSAGEISLPMLGTVAV